MKIQEISNIHLLETQFGCFWMKPAILCLHIFTANSYQREKTFMVHKTHQVKEENKFLRHITEKQNED